MASQSSINRLFKLGKKFCFPDVPSSWVPRTVEFLLHYQDPRPKSQILRSEPKTRIWYSRLPIPRYEFYKIPDDGVYDDRVYDGFMWCSINRSTISTFFDEQRDNNEDPICLKKGEPFDVMSLLSTIDDEENSSRGYLVRNDGRKVEVDTLKGKNVLVCCFYVPVFWLTNDCNTIRGIITAYSKLSDDYEMVMVAKMRRNWAIDEDAFNHFFSAFPSSWLAVPFSDTLRRDRICSSLGLAGSTDSIALLVDHHQKVVLHEDSFENDNGLSFPPFFKDPWWKIRNKLHLNLDSEFVYKLKSSADGTNNSATVCIDHENKISVFELEEKLVGLYLCFDGILIRSLDLVSRECKARDKEFHIVLVYLPYMESVDPLLFQEAVNHVLHKLEIYANPHWWVSPFDDFVSRRLFEAAADSYYEYREDQLIIFDPKMNIADYMGKQVINRLGINGYPFTRHFLLRRELEAIRTVTLESLLVYGSRDYVLRTNMTKGNVIDEVPIGELRGKNVLLYMDQVEMPSNKYSTLLEWYNRNKTAGVADFEVVFVHFDGEAEASTCTSTSFGSPNPLSMPWLVCPFDPQHTAFVKRQILKARRGKHILAAFDKDGNLITLFGEDLLDSFGAEGFPSYKGLHNEMAQHVDIEHILSMDDLYDHGPVRLDISSSPLSQEELNT